MRHESKWHTLLLPLLACCLSSPLSGQSPDVCQTRNLTIQLKRVGASGGRMAFVYVLTNGGNQTCTLTGYPSAVALSGQKQIVGQIRFEQVVPSPEDSEEWRVRTIRLKPGEHASFRIETQDGMGLEDSSFCAKATLVRITPPQNRRPFHHLFPFTDCVPTAFVYFLEAGSED